MKSRLVSLFHSVVGLFHRRQAEPPLSAEQFRRMLEQAMSEPETRRLLLRSFISQFPIQGGACISAGAALVRLQ